MTSVASRLAKVRKIMGMSQSDFSRIGGVQRTAQSHYETGARDPSLEYFLALHDAGVDVYYILTGVPSPGEFTEKEKQLLSLFRQLDERGRDMLLLSATGLASTGLAVSGDKNRVAVITGDVHAPIDMSSKKKSRSPQS